LFPVLKQIELPPRGLETLSAFTIRTSNILNRCSMSALTRAVRTFPLMATRRMWPLPSAFSKISPNSSEGRSFTDKELREAFAQIAEDRAFSLRDYFTKARFNPAGKKQVAPKSGNTTQIHSGDPGGVDVVFGIGVAGTGKTYLAVALAVQGADAKAGSTASCWRVPQWKPERSLAFFPATCRRKLILICGRFTTRC